MSGRIRVTKTSALIYSAGDSGAGQIQLSKGAILQALVTSFGIKNGEISIKVADGVPVSINGTVVFRRGKDEIDMDGCHFVYEEKEE